MPRARLPVRCRCGHAGQVDAADIRAWRPLPEHILLAGWVHSQGWNAAQLSGVHPSDVEQGGHQVARLCQACARAFHRYARGTDAQLALPQGNVEAGMEGNSTQEAEPVNGAIYHDAADVTDAPSDAGMRSGTTEAASLPAVVFTGVAPRKYQKRVGSMSNSEL